MNGTVDLSFRKEASRITAMLLSRYGAANLGNIEDAVQETFLRALKTWPIDGEPVNPRAWLHLVAKRIMTDKVRREQIYLPAAEAEEGFAPTAPEPTILGDEELELLILCCHPALPAETKIALTLREVCGYGASEIARNLLLSESAVAQRLVRGKRSLKEVGPDDYKVLPELRIEPLRKVLYLMFNKGYSLYGDEGHTPTEICDEAISLTYRLANSKAGSQPATYALLALMLFQSSRAAARLDEEGAACLLQDQDRRKWDRERIELGFQAFSKSAAGPELSSYHVEAAIAAEHARSAISGRTDWGAIVRAYDQLLRLGPSSVVRLNRAVAVGMARGPSEGLALLDKLCPDPSLARYHLLSAARGQFLQELGRLKEAISAYRAALACATGTPDRLLLTRKINAIDILILS